MSKQALHKSSEGNHLTTALFEIPARAWHGEEKLGRVFWGYGVFVSSSLILLYIITLYGEYLISQQILLLCFAPYTVWVLVSVWRCASHADPYWGLLARWLTVAWAANAILILIFLQLVLVTGYLAR